MQYSPDRRTALVFSGTGVDGAYHAGALRALNEAGVRVDLLAGHGIGTVGALFGAIDGGSRLWEPGGLWRSAAISHRHLQHLSRNHLLPALPRSVLNSARRVCGASSPTPELMT